MCMRVERPAFSTHRHWSGTSWWSPPSPWSRTKPAADPATCKQTKKNPYQNVRGSSCVASMRGVNAPQTAHYAMAYLSSSTGLWPIRARSVHSVQIDSPRDLPILCWLNHGAAVPPARTVPTALWHGFIGHPRLAIASLMKVLNNNVGKNRICERKLYNGPTKADLSLIRSSLCEKRSRFGNGSAGY